jgi:hypothetical protein
VWASAVPRTAGARCHPHHTTQFCSTNVTHADCFHRCSRHALCCCGRLPFRPLSALQAFPAQHIRLRNTRESRFLVTPALPEPFRRFSGKTLIDMALAMRIVAVPAMRPSHGLRSTTTHATAPQQCLSACRPTTYCPCPASVIAPTCVGRLSSLSSLLHRLSPHHVSTQVGSAI